MRNLVLVATTALLLASCGDESQISEELLAEQNKAISKVNYEDIMYHIRVLSDDALEGRETGTRGYKAAADYVALQYKQMGLESFYGRDGYFQTVKLAGAQLDGESHQFSIEDEELLWRDDYFVKPHFVEKNIVLTAPLVFAGFGITSPENEIDDYAKVDVAGKIAVVVSGAPSNLTNTERAYYSRSKEQMAIEQGAIGLITIRSTTDQNRRDYSFYMPTVMSKKLGWVKNNGEVYRGFSKLKLISTLSQSGAEKLFAGSEISLEKILADAEENISHSFDMGKAATININSTHDIVNSNNVVGFIEGSDPTLKNEFVIYGAHLDHMGIKPGKYGDNIYNGAYDNASGVGIMLEIANLISKMELKPKRSMLFVAFTAEENGLQGSDYFASNTPVPTNRLVANVNIDMPMLTFPMNDFIVVGAEHSSLLAASQQAADSLGLKLTPDPFPEEVLILRSDQYSFMKKGIPSIFYISGENSTDPRIDGRKKVLSFLKNHYHQPSDQINLTFDETAMLNYSKGALLIGLNIANTLDRPKWNEGDFFQKKFAKE